MQCPRKAVCANELLREGATACELVKRMVVKAMQASTGSEGGRARPRWGTALAKRYGIPVLQRSLCVDAPGLVRARATHGKASSAHRFRT